MPFRREQDDFDGIVFNRLEISGDNVEKIIEEICSYDAIGRYTIDFNKIIPSPYIYYLTEDKAEAFYIYVSYLSRRNPDVVKEGIEKVWELDIQKILRYTSDIPKLYGKDENVVFKLSQEQIDKTMAMLQEKNGWDEQTVLDIGKEVLDHYMRATANNTYEWNSAYWGVTTNAGYVRTEGTVIEFITDLRPATKFIKLLAKKYPENIFDHKFANEYLCDGGGHYTYQNDKVIYKKPYKGDELIDFARQLFEPCGRFYLNSKRDWFQKRKQF